MSPELNGNQPVLPKRKKNRERKHASTSNIRQEFNIPSSTMSSYYHFQPNPNAYCPYPTAPTFAIHPEPMSLPIYPPSYHHYNSPPTPMYNGNGNRMFKATPKTFQNEECMSLPVVKDEIEEESGQRRYSDPGLPNDSDTSSEADHQMFQMLSHQVNVLQESNRQLMREVTELRMELNMLKQQQMHSNGFDRDYEPGMISDFIKEIRDAARIREDALLAKVKHMVEEKQFSANQFQLATEKFRDNERISKLEEQMKTLNVTNTSVSALGNGNNSLIRLEDNISLPSTSLTDDHSIHANRQVYEMEREVLQLRREVQDYRSKKEDSDSKIVQLEKRLSTLLHHSHYQQHLSPTSIHRRESTLSTTETLNSDDKASLSSSTTMDNLSIITSTQSSVVSSSPLHHKFMQIGPVTDL